MGSTADGDVWRGRLSTITNRSTRARALRSFTSMLGFPRNLIVSEFPVVTGSHGGLILDLVGFGRLPLDMASAVLVGEVADGDASSSSDNAVAAALALAAPLTVIAGSDGLEIISTSDATRLDFIRYGERPSDRLAEELQVDRLLAAKLRPRQMSLFPADVDMLARARRSAVDRLRNRVVEAKEDVVLAAKDMDRHLSRGDVAGLLVDALTSLFLEDKFQVEHGSESWWREARTRFRELANDVDQFDTHSRALFDLARLHLREGVDYRSLDSVVVADLYEPRLVNPGDKDEFGVVYTPHELASRILERVPVELIPPERRRVLDFACGSGTLLLAAHDRLNSSLPGHSSAGRKHNYLLRHLEGWDRDPFAVRLAHLSLTIHGHPLGNGWKVKQADSLRPDAEADPTIIVANPPWLARRSGGSSSSRSRDDAADPFVKRALEMLPSTGLMALLLPAGWLTARHSTGTRQLLSERCDVLEVWRLPEGAFPPAEVKGAVIIARVRETADRHLSWYFSRNIPTKFALQALYAENKFGETSLSPAVDSGRPLASASSVTEWMKNQQGGPLGSVVRFRSGPPRGRGVEIGPSYRWLGNVRAMSHFGHVPESAVTMAHYPGDFDPAAGWSIDDLYEQPKLLVTRVSRSNTPWKIKIGFAFDPLIPSNNQYGLMLRQSSNSTATRGRLYALGAVLGSALVSAWLDRLVTTGNIRRELLERLQIPRGWEGLATLAEEMAYLVESDAPPSVVSLAAREIDAAVFELYKAPGPVVSDVLDSLAGARAREGVVRYAHSMLVEQPATETLQESAGSCRDGVVLGVANGLVVLWVDGVTSEAGARVPVPDGLPAAALIPDTTFKVILGKDGLADGQFSLHGSSYLSADQLLPTADR